jgi:hypothetical protein
MAADERTISGGLAALRLDGTSPLIEALGNYMHWLSVLHLAWRKSQADVAEKHEELYAAREPLTTAVSAGVVPPPGQSGLQFAAHILNLVDESWHLCRFVRAFEPGDKPKDPDLNRVLREMHERLPALHHELRTVWLHLKHVASLEAHGAAGQNQEATKLWDAQIPNKAQASQEQEWPVVDPESFSISWNGRICILKNTKPFRVYQYLDKHRGQHRNHEAIFQAAWDGADPDQGPLYQAVLRLNKALAVARIDCVCIDGTTKGHYRLCLVPTTNVSQMSPES